MGEVDVITSRRRSLSRDPPAAASPARSRTGSETAGIQELEGLEASEPIDEKVKLEHRDSNDIVELRDLEAASALNENINEEVSIISTTPERSPVKADDLVDCTSPSYSTPMASIENVPRRRKGAPLEFDLSRNIEVLGSDLEDEATPRKPSRISIDERLTVFCDDEDTDTSPLHSPSPSQDRFPPLPPSGCGFFYFFWSELTRGYSLHNDEARYSEKRRKVYAFLRIPIELEQFLSYGLLQCVDAFCYLFTFLPLRFFMSIFGWLLRLRPWTSADTCDVLKVGIIVSSSILIREIDSSVLYHQVRSQGVIKLYIFYNMLEVADRLFSSLGQDILDSLFWTANEPNRSAMKFVRSFGHLIIAIFYTTLHTFLVILQATTLNVAFNSHNQAVLAIMMSNNFVELKGSVFKKFAKANLFQMACSDVRERFHMFSLLFVVIVRNLMAVNWSVESLAEMLPDIAMVIGAELLVDWFKHAFITKFNEISAEVYKDFTITIAFDVIRSREKSAFSDYSDQVSRRMGFIPIPLSVMMIRVVSQTFSIENRFSIFLCFLGWLLIFAAKFCNSVIMLGKACQHVKRYREFQARAEYDLFRKRMVEKKSKSAPNSPRMSLIDFTDVLHQPSGIKGFTVSDMLSQWEELQPVQSGERRSSERNDSNERTPRRTKSMAHIARRDRSEPPPTVGEEVSNITTATSEQRIDDESVVTKPVERSRENSEQLSPKKRTGSRNELTGVTAYQMPSQGVQRIE